MRAHNSAEDCTVAVSPVDGRQSDEKPESGLKTALQAGCDQPSGARVGRYLVIDELGRGGMGVVQRGYDPRLQREVALKSLRADALSATAQAQLLREAQAMAQLSHPNVVAIHDVELWGDAFVISMEYVRGTTLKAWFEREKRPWREVVAALVSAGRGLVAAHDVGLLHRDFKPANILVGDDGRVRVTDFGLARAHDGAETSMPSPRPGTIEDTHTSPERTAVGVIKGTAAYMAPEQHEGAELGPAADQFAFCVTLWEGLTGDRPYRGNDDWSLMTAKSLGAPPWPRDIAVPRRVSDAIRRGLNPDPSARWPSMEELLDVLSRDPRQRSFAVATAIATTAVAAGVTWNLRQQAQDALCSGASTRLAEIWNPSRREAVGNAVLATKLYFAEDAWTRAREQLDAYASTWGGMYTRACEATSVRGEQPVEVMDLKMACLERAATDLKAITDLLVNAEVQMVQRVHSMVGSLPQLATCDDVEALKTGIAPPRPEDREAIEQLRTSVAEAKALGQAGKYLESRERIEQAARDAERIGYAPLQAEVMLALGDTRRAAGASAEAVDALRAALRLGMRSKLWGVAQNAASSLFFIVGVDESQPPVGFAFAETAKALVAFGEHDADAALHSDMGVVLTNQGRYAEAEKELRIALALRQGGDDLVILAGMHNNLANVLADQGKLEEAEAQYRASAALYEQVVGSKHPLVANPRNNLGNVLASLGRFEEAEAETRAALLIRENTLPPGHPGLASARENLGIILLASGRAREAERELRAALQMRHDLTGPDHPDMVTPQQYLGRALLEQGRFEEAEVELRAAQAIAERSFGPAHPYVGMTRGALAGALIGQGRKVEGERELRAAIGILRAALGPDHQSVTSLETQLPTTREASPKSAR